MRRLAAIVLASAALAGCDGGEAATPTPLAAKSIPPAPTAIGPKRTIETRNPFGNTATRGNLMVDGDFELTGRSDQMGWLALGTDGQDVLDYATGGRCRSGIRCARMAPGKGLLGYVASPKEGDLHIVFWAKPNAVCSEIVAIVVDVDDPTRSAPIGAESPLPDPTGWCRFDGTTPSFARLAPALYLQFDADAGGEVLIDDAVATAAPSVTVDGGVQTRAYYTTDGPTADRLRAFASWLKGHRRLARPDDTSRTGTAR